MRNFGGMYGKFYVDEIYRPIWEISKTRWREQFLDNRWLHISKEIVYKKTVSCNETLSLKILGKIVYKVKWKLKKWSEKTVQGLEETREEVL
jgi:hypothetical protein